MVYSRKIPKLRCLTGKIPKGLNNDTLLQIAQKLVSRYSNGENLTRLATPMVFLSLFYFLYFIPLEYNTIDTIKDMSIIICAICFLCLDRLQFLMTQQSILRHIICMMINMVNLLKGYHT